MPPKNEGEDFQDSSMIQQEEKQEGSKIERGRVVKYVCHGQRSSVLERDRECRKTSDPSRISPSS